MLWKNLNQNDFDIDKNGVKFKTCNKCRTDQKQRRGENREDINKQAREYYKKNLREEKIDQAKQYRNDNREKLYEIQKCECGGKYIYRGKCQHIKCKKHMDYIESQNIQYIFI